jgi:hypothetical protein
MPLLPTRLHGLTDLSGAGMSGTRRNTIDCENARDGCEMYDLEAAVGLIDQSLEIYSWLEIEETEARQAIECDSRSTILTAAECEASWALGTAGLSGQAHCRRVCAQWCLVSRGTQRGCSVCRRLLMDAEVTTLSPKPHAPLEVGITLASGRCGFTSIAAAESTESLIKGIFPFFSPPPASDNAGSVDSHATFYTGQQVGHRNIFTYPTSRISLLRHAQFERRDSQLISHPPVAH